MYLFIVFCLLFFRFLYWYLCWLTVFTIQPIIDPYQESSMENLGKSALRHCMFALLTNVWGSLKILRSKILLDAVNQTSKLQQEQIFQPHPVKS